AAALRHGRGPAALASVVSVALFDFFFVQPLASFIARRPPWPRAWPFRFCTRPISS
ncbi:hypothetical protein CKW48_20990, partial [Bordetella pertussis]